jgi:hypothetical protein
MAALIAGLLTVLRAPSLATQNFRKACMRSEQPGLRKAA